MNRSDTLSRSAPELGRTLLLGLVLLPVLLVATTSASYGHAFAPSLVELRQSGDQTFDVCFKQPVVRRSGSELRPVLPSPCRATSSAAIETVGTGVVARWQVQCPGGLVGRTIAVDGIAESQADVLVRLELADGRGASTRSVRHVLTAHEPAFVVPERESVWQVMRGYGVLGVEHILFGFDHLLFVLGLVLLVRGGRRLLLTITAFTLGHSVTLALASLGLVHLPSGPIEALIALSILVLAVELAERSLSQASTTPESTAQASTTQASTTQAQAAVRGPRFAIERAPWWTAAGFGLLHGLGFAGALSEIGLPAGEIPAALFAFNVGIELGQLAFVAAVLVLGRALAWTIAKLPVPLPRRWALAPAYGIGILAAFWTVERLVGSIPA